MAGPIVAAIVSALEGVAVVGGLSALSGALVSLGVPENKALEYETEILAGKFVLIVHGTHEEVTRAGQLLEQTENQVRASAWYERLPLPGDLIHLRLGLLPTRNRGLCESSCFV